MNLLSTAEATLQLAALQERCILVDSYDKSIGDATKKECHIVNPDGQVLLHRAFSVFLFNNKGELLLQKRSASKVTFPNHYTNTCCSHPLFEISGETEEHDAIGIRRAARRRLNYELGIPLSQISISDFVYLTRIHYFAVESEWGEHEIDYVLFIQKDNLKLDPNPDEISELCWISQSEINNFVKNLNAPLTPWFKLILEHKLPEWWNNLHSTTVDEVVRNDDDPPPYSPIAPPNHVGWPFDFSGNRYSAYNATTYTTAPLAPFQTSLTSPGFGFHTERAEEHASISMPLMPCRLFMFGSRRSLFPHDGPTFTDNISVNKEDNHERTRRYGAILIGAAVIIFLMVLSLLVRLIMDKNLWRS